MDFSGLRIGFVPFHKGSLHPFDLRNFIYYARKRNLKFEIVKTGEEYDIIILTPRVDLSVWSRYPKGKAKIIFMLVDSYLAVPRFNIKGALRGLAKYVVREFKYLRFNYTKALQDMCRRADAVVCTTLEQKKDIQNYCRNVHVILEFHFKVIREIKTDYSIGRRVNLVWEGRPENISGIVQIKEVLAQLKNKYPLALHIVTDLTYKKYITKFRTVSMVDELKRIFNEGYFSNVVGGNESMVYLYQWNLEMFSRIITGCDIAVIPLNARDSLMYGKPENKLLLFWRMGMPTIVSATPAYIRAMKRSGLSLYCKNNEEWYENLEKLIVDSDARRTAGLQGKEIAETVYSEEQYLKQWDQLFESVLI